MIDCVVSRYKRNVDWVQKLKNINRCCIYDKETPENPYNVPVNKGNEASVYLKFIVDHYECLSDYTFFIHDEEFAWHHSGSIIDQYDEAVSSGRLYYNINDKCVLGSVQPLNDEMTKWYESYIEKYIPMNSLPNKDWTVGHRGSAQFLVHKSLITKLPKEFYENLYEWITTTEISSYNSGRYMEWTWHIFWVLYPQIAL